MRCRPSRFRSRREDFVPNQRRRAIILLTDGRDSTSRLSRSDAINRALDAETVIYAIGIGDKKYGGVDRDELNAVANATGGRAFFPKRETDLTSAFGEIEQELRSQYLIAYSPTNKNRDGQLPAAAADLQDLDRTLIAATQKLPQDLAQAYQRLELQQCATLAVDLARATNGYIDATAPWKLAKDPAQSQRLDTVLHAAPSAAADDEFRRWWNRVGQRAASPQTAATIRTIATRTDLRHRLPSVSAPTLVLHRRS